MRYFDEPQSDELQECEEYELTLDLFSRSLPDLEKIKSDLNQKKLTFEELLAKYEESLSGWIH